MSAGLGSRAIGLRGAAAEPLSVNEWREMGLTQVSPDARRKRERHARSKAPNSAGAVSLKKDTPMIASASAGAEIHEVSCCTASGVRGTARARRRWGC